MPSKQDYELLKKTRDENKNHPYLILFLNWSPVVFFAYSFLTLDKNKLVFDIAMLCLAAIGTGYSVYQASHTMTKTKKIMALLACVALGLIFTQVRFYFFNQDAELLQILLEWIRR